ncbi:protein croquemort-like isoform X2 [Dermacentor variabilis]|uniref:protein croquemort-like isoform X2 n=1 Tax=Dermacentor variabilis TaxID=34621 RepID=UPI003F5C7B10
MPGPEIEKMTTRCCGQRASRPDMALVKAAVGVLAGLFLALSGLATYVFFPAIFKTQVELNLVLEPSSEVYSSWQRAPVPIYLKYYFFNMTNPDEILAGTEKARLQEVGPYTFLETREKVNITWNPNGTVSYRQVKRYYFQPDMTKGSLDDVITTLNMPMISSAHSVRHAPDDFFSDALPEIFSDTESKLFVSKTMRELLFEGYEDSILQFAKRLGYPVPSERFGWLHGKNDTDDGEYTIFTGAKGMDNYGAMDKFNGRDETSAYRGYCNMVNGTVGDMWPPVALENKDNITLFVSDFCRSIDMEFLGDVETRGVKLRRYYASPRMFNYSSQESHCFCDSTCLPNGALNVSACVKGAPVIISFPHYLYAHPIYQMRLEGIKPDPKKHQMYLDIEPKMGITVNAVAKFQVNVWIDHIPDVPFFEDITQRRFFPVFWFENLASADKDMLSRLRLVTEELPQYVTVGAFGAVIIGGIILLATLVYAIRYVKRPKPVQPTYIPVRVLK